MASLGATRGSGPRAGGWPGASTAGDGPPDPARESHARKILRACDSRGWAIGPDGTLDVLPTHRSLADRGLMDVPTAAHHAELAEFLPEVLALKYPAPRAGRGPARVGASTRRRVRARLAGLAGHPEPREAARAARRCLTLALCGPSPGVARALEGAALEVAEGRLGVGRLVEAFELACVAGVEDRCGLLASEVAQIGPARPGWGS